MLDENLPTFRFKPASDNPLSSVVFFTQNGADPSADYVLRRADPAVPGSRNRYAVALCDAYNPDVIYGEVMIEPEWSQPTLSTAEIRAQAQNGAGPALATPLIPDNFTIQLYNPDQSVNIKLVPGGWNKTDSWEFELPIQTFRMPSVSELDREHRVPPADLAPRIMFRWKKDGKLTKDMTCFMTGKNLGGRKSKEPDITIALFKAARDTAVTIYQPNLQRVEVEDNKGLEIVLLLSAEIVKDLYLMPKQDVFNISGGGPSPSALNGGGRRKNSRPTAAQAPSPPIPPLAMSGALGNIPPQAQRYSPVSQPYPSPPLAAHSVPPGAIGPSAADIEAETRRLQAMVEREDREREKRERADQKRIKRMLEEEEEENRRREEAVAKETERLRKKYGVDGQDLPHYRPSGIVSPPTPPPPPAAPPLPPRNNPVPQFAPPPLVPLPPPHLQPAQNSSNWFGSSLPTRPVSAGPNGAGPGPFHCSTLNNMWGAAAGAI
ncbi:hypothetical protein B0T26DRAFT_602508, partial [Lasiosphaeria miniovina]